MRYGLKKRKIRSRVTGLLLLMALAAGICAGCGGEYIGMSGKGAASGGGVSGQAVSGGAVKPAGKDRSKKYTYCNERNLYYIGDDFKAVERNRKTCEERTLQMEVDAICYVDADWLYYLTYIGDEINSRNQIWRVPVRREQQWKVDESAAEMILEKNLGGSSHYIDYWCNGSYIIFVGDTEEGSDKLQMYNIRKKQYDPAEDTDVWRILALFEDRVIFSSEKGLGEKKFGAEPVNWFREQKELYLHFWTSDMEKDEFFWVERESLEEPIVLWRYRLKDGKKKKIADEEDDQIRQFLKEKGLLEDCEAAADHKVAIWGCFVQEGTLYVLLWICGGDEPPYCYNVVVISKDLDDPGEWRWEKEINEHLHNPESEQKVFQKIGRQGIENDCIYRSRGCVVAMAEGICLMYMEHTGEKKNQFASYDLHTGKFKWLTEKDAEWYLQDYDRYNCLGLDSERQYYYCMESLPNNY